MSSDRDRSSRPKSKKSTAKFGADWEEVFQRHGESSATHQWLEEEIRSRLVEVNMKLDMIISQAKSTSVGKQVDISGRPIAKLLRTTTSTSSQESMDANMEKRLRSKEDTYEEMGHSHPRATPQRSNPQTTRKQGSKEKVDGDKSKLSGHSKPEIVERTCTAFPSGMGIHLGPQTPVCPLPALTFGASWPVEHLKPDVIEEPASADTVAIDSDALNAQELLSQNSTSAEAPPTWQSTDRQNTQHGGVLWAVWSFLEDPDSSGPARMFAKVMRIFLLCSVIIAFAESADHRLLDRVAIAVLQTTIETLFLFEVIVRFFAMPRRVAFLCIPYNVFDIMAASPLILRAIIGFVPPDTETDLDSLPRTILQSLAPGLRLLKTLRWFERFNLLLVAFDLVLEALPMLLFTFCTLMMIFAPLIFIFEPRDNIESFGTAVWLTIVTATTVGYGDKTPKSPGGSIVVSLLIITSVLYMAMPLGIIGEAFQQIWRNREQILVARAARDRILHCGFAATDLPSLFMEFSCNANGDLDFRAFHDMLGKMRIYFSYERVAELFQVFDYTGDGMISHQEFVRILFPAQYCEIYTSRVRRPSITSNTSVKASNTSDEDLGRTLSSSRPTRL